MVKHCLSNFLNACLPIYSQFSQHAWVGSYYLIKVLRDKSQVTVDLGMWEVTHLRKL